MPKPTDRQIADAIKAGATTVEEIARAVGQPDQTALCRQITHMATHGGWFTQTKTGPDTYRLDVIR